MMKTETETLKEIKIERKELNEKVDKLKDFMKTIQFEKSINKTQRELLKMQYKTMEDYSIILYKRINDFYSRGIR